MNCQQLSALSEDLNFRRLLLSSVCIAERTIDNLPVLLFQKDGSYIEVIFSEAGDKILTWWNFSSIEALEPYLDQIALPEFVHA